MLAVIFIVIGFVTIYQNRSDVEAYFFGFGFVVVGIIYVIWGFVMHRKYHNNDTSQENVNGADD